MTLHITNGDAAASLLRRAGLPGDVLPWRDVLHDGPAPAGLGLEEFSEVRARYLAGCGYGAVDTLTDAFRQRDARLESAAASGEAVVLWFEHDLYDQLQLLQLLDWFSRRPDAATPEAVTADGFLGDRSPEELARLYPARRPLVQAQFALARRAWEAFCAPQPVAWGQLLGGDCAALPHLASAVLRQAEEFPSVDCGLSRTERQILEIAGRDPCTPAELFRRATEREEAPFMGDWSFWRHLERLLAGAEPALAAGGASISFPPACDDERALRERTLSLSGAGRRLLRGETDWTDLQPLDRWLGGVHLTERNVWRWDARREQLLEDERQR